MLQVDQFDHMIVSNAGLRPVRRGGYQAVEHWLLRMVLVKTYLLALYSDVEAPRSVSFRSQQDFRIQLMDALLYKAKTSEPSRKRSISYISYDAIDTPAQQHELVKRSTRKDCVL